MTCISNVILTTSIHDGAWAQSDYGSVDELNNYLSDKYQGTRLIGVDHHAGGRKPMGCDVFIAAVDYLDIEAFLKAFATIKWDKPEQVQLLIRSENDAVFKAFHPEIP